MYDSGDDEVNQKVSALLIFIVSRINVKYEKNTKAKMHKHFMRKIPTNPSTKYDMLPKTTGWRERFYFHSV